MWLEQSGKQGVVGDGGSDHERFAILEFALQNGGNCLSLFTRKMVFAQEHFPRNGLMAVRDILRGTREANEQVGHPCSSLVRGKGALYQWWSWQGREKKRDSRGIWKIK